MKNILFMFLLVLTVIILSLTCTEEPAGPDINPDILPKGTITGYIFDMWNRPIKDVLVSVDADSAVPGVSKANGQFTVGNVLPGTYTIRFTHRDYEDDSTYLITLDQGVHDTLEDAVKLSYAYYILAGKVIYNTTPVPGAGVALAGYPISTLTDVTGQFLLDHVPKNTRIKLICAKSGIGFCTDSSIIGIADDTTLVSDISLVGQGATIYGTVYDTSGNTVDSVVVAAVGGGLVDTTDKYGNYILENVPSNENVRIFVPSSDQFYGSTIGFMLKDGSKSRIDIYLRPVSDLINGNGMALYVNDMIVNESISPVLLPVFPTTDVNTVIDTFTWTLTGSTKFITRKTIEPVLSISMDSLKTLTARSISKTVKVGVIAKNTRGELSEGQVFTVTITTTAPEAIAKGSAVENGPLSDTIKIKINEPAYFYGEAHDPFGGIDSAIWDFGDGSPTVLNINDISHIYSQLDTFNAIFTVIDLDGNTAADTVVVIVEEPAIGRPKNISPINGDTLYNIDTVTLTWHPVQGSGITYDIYLDSLNFPAGILKQANITDTNALFVVDSGITYSWKIVAKRGSEIGVGDSWKFSAGGSLDTIPYGLVAYYPFNGNANDESGNGNDGTVNGAVLANDRFGNENKAYYFDGSSYINCGNGPSLDITEALTISAWVYTTQTDDNLSHSIVSKTNLDNNHVQYHLMHHYFTGTWQGQTCDYNGEFGLTYYSAATGYVDNISNSALPLGSWNHIVGTFNGTSVKIYLNSDLDKEYASKISQLISNNFSVGIGGHCTGQWREYTDGIIDDIRIYNRVLSPAEIDSLYHLNGWPVNQPPTFTIDSTSMTDTATVVNEYRDTLKAIDPDGDALTFSFLDSVAGMVLVDNIITLTPQIIDTGKHSIKVQVTDNKGGFDTLCWTISVKVSKLQVLNVESTSGYTVSISFNNKMNEASVIKIENYEVTHRLYDLVIIDADLDSTKKIVTLTSSNSQGAFQDLPGDSTYYLTLRNIEDIYGNIFVNNSFTTPFIGSVPVGIANFGNTDNYTITGTVTDTNGNPIPNYMFVICNGGVDGIESNDDVFLVLTSDSSGKYTFEGLPSQPGLNIDSIGLYGLRSSDWYTGPYEVYWFCFNIADHPSPYSRNIILRHVVPGTKIEGYMKDNEGNILPLQGGEDDIGPHLTRDDLLYVVEMDPFLSNPTEKRHYNLQTGYYHIRDCIAGGTYKILSGPGLVNALPGYSDYEKMIYIEPGKTTTHDVTVYKLTGNNLLPIYITSPVSGTSPSSPIAFTWEKTDHRDIQSYTLGIWSPTNVDTTSGIALPQGAPNMFYYIVPDTVLNIIIDPTTSPMTITGTIYNEITNIKINTGEKYYWGIFAYDIPYNEANSGSSFSGEPVQGLWSFIAP